jgi:hypothetical protein
MEDRMNSELAFNLNGEPFDVPANTVGWRVRRMKSKGAPEVVYGRNGLPLVLPIEADLDDVRAETGVPGRYRLDPVDESNRPIANAPAGYVYVHEQRNEPEVERTAVVVPTDNVVIEAMRMNSEIAKSVVDRFPQMLEAAAVLLQAADGAGLPARPGMVVDDSDDDNEDDEATPRTGLDIGAMLMNAAPLIMAFTSGKLNLSELFNWKKAAAKGEASRSEKALTPATDEAASEAGERIAAHMQSVEQQLMSDPAAMQHFMAIMATLTPEERTVAQAIAMELSDSERTAWFSDLKALSVADAVAKVRGLLGEIKKGGAS